MRAYLYLIWSLAAFGVGLLLVPLESNFEIAVSTALQWTLLATMSVAGLAMGYALGRPSSAPRSADTFSVGQASVRVNWLALIGLTCTLIDRYLLRGVALDFDLISVHDVLESTQPSVVGLIGAVLGAFSCFTLILTVARSQVEGALGRRAWLTSAAIQLIYVGISLGIGSRSTLLVSVISTMFSVIWLRRAMRQPMQLGLWAVTLTAIAGVAVISAALMLERLEQMGLDPFLSIEVSAYAYAVRPTPAALAWLNTHGESAPLWVVAFGLLQYVFHGIYEFCILAQQQLMTHTYGAVTFWLPLKLLGIVGLGDQATGLDSIPGWREGIFTTFLGPLYLDFGAWTFLASFLLFLALGLPAAHLRMDRLAMLPYCSVLCSLCVLYPIVNLLGSASGAYPLVASLFLPLLGRRRSHPAPRFSSREAT